MNYDIINCGDNIMAYNYIIASDDYDAALNKIEEIRKSFKIEFDEVKYDLEDDGAYSVVDELTTISLFDNPKFMILKSCESITSMKENAFNELIKAMNDIDSQNVLIFLFLKKLDYNHEHIERIRKYSSLINIKIKDIPFDEYIKTSIERDGYQMDNQAISLLASYHSSLTSLIQSLEQLKCYKADNKVINDKDIKLIVTKPLEDNVYQLLEAVIMNDKKSIFTRYNDLRQINIQPSYLISLLINKFQELYNVSILIKSNVGQNEIGMLFNVSSGRAYYMMKNAKGTSIDNIKRNLKLLNDLDYKIKTGRIEQSLGLELYFLN